MQYLENRTIKSDNINEVNRVYKDEKLSNKQIKALISLFKQRLQESLDDDAMKATEEYMTDYDKKIGETPWKNFPDLFEFNLKKKKVFYPAGKKGKVIILEYKKGN